MNSECVLVNQKTVPKTQMAGAIEQLTEWTVEARVDSGRGQDRTLRGMSPVECAIDGSPHGQRHACRDERITERNWSDVLRVAASLASGVLPPSQLLRKFAAYPRQHELAVALREIGRIERTNALHRRLAA